MSRISAAVAFALAATLPAIVRADEPKPASTLESARKVDAGLVKTAQTVFTGLRTATLDNGLRIYLLPSADAATVSVITAYRVGSGDEVKTQTGLSHYLEHLMFKGTEKLMPGDIDRLTQRNGGQNNAYTTEDMTVFHFDFAAGRWKPALEIEADRMRNLRIDTKHEFEQEKGAVISELNRDEDMPGDLEMKTILPLLFPTESPYSHPVIGEKKHVEGATAAIIKSHYDKWYHPNNASLVMVGGFDADAALAEIKKLFGSIPKAKLPERHAPATFTDRQGPVHKDFTSKFDVPRMLMGFNTVPIGSPDDPVLDVFAEILGDGKLARLYTNLVEGEQIATSVSASNNSLRTAGWFSISLDLFKGKDRKQAEALVFGILEKLAATPISDEELNRALRKIVAARVFGIESVHGMANSLAVTSAYPVGENVTEYYQKYYNRLLAITKADIQRVAKEYFARRQAVVVWSVPLETKPGEPEKKPTASRPPSGDSESTGAGMRANRDRVRASRSQPPAGVKIDAGGSGISLTSAKRTVLDNGLTVIVLEDHRLPIVVADVEFEDVVLREPAAKAGVATLMGNLLDEGTTTHSSKQIATAIEDTGGSLSFGSAEGDLKVLTPDTTLGLDLLFDCLLHSRFPAASFDRMKEQQLSTIDDDETQPNIRAAQIFSALVYGKHPYGRPSKGTHATVEKLTRADVEEFHELAYAPNFATVVVVGDVKTEVVVAAIKELTKDWKKSTAGKPVVPAPPKPTKVTEKIVSDPTADQVYVYIGELGITRDNPDYYKLLVMDNVLGTGAGFTYRLSAHLRDRQGLAYSVYATITNTAGRERGTFSGYIDTFPKYFLTVRAGFLAEIKDIRDTLATNAEVEDAKQYLLGSLPFRFTTLSKVASELQAIERYHLGFDFPEKFEKAVRAVTREDVQAVAQKYLDPNTLTIVAVGAIDQQGKPLEAKKE